MLPGFRFLFAAIVLSMSVLVFGLGAAALLRAAHEEFASIPARRAPPETMFAQQSEATPPMLALLRIDAPMEQKAADDIPPAAQAEIASIPAEPETTATVKPENLSPPAPVAETLPAAEAAPAQAAPATTEETKIAVAELPETEAVATSPEKASGPNPQDIGTASTKIAMLGGPPVTIEPPAVSPKPAKTDVKNKTDVKKRRQAQRPAARRHRIRLTAQAPQQPTDAFGQPTITVRSR